VCITCADVFPCLHGAAEMLLKVSLAFTILWAIVRQSLKFMLVELAFTQYIDTVM